MASINIGPGGIAIQGEHNCSSNNFLADQGNPLGALKVTLTEQILTGIKTLKYPSMAEAVDKHMPMQAQSSKRVNGVVTYRTDVGYEGLLNSDGVEDVTPGDGTYTNTRNLLTACNGTRSKGITSGANTNAEGCNPVIDGPLPLIGREEYGRRGFVTRLPVPPLCFTDFVNKEAFHAHLSAVLESVRNATMTRFAADQYRWIIQQSRFNASPIQVSQGNGKAKLPVDASLFSSGTFGRVPQHYGSADWLAAMLRLSEIDPAQNVTVDLPTSIFVKYKEQLATAIGINVFEQAGNITAALNNFTRTIQNDTLIYQDQVTGRKITFVASTTPIYVEVEESNTTGGSWQFQEPWTTRDSETAGQIMRRANPNYGVACSCPNKTLAAIVTVSADNSKPFHKEPFPTDNPDTRLRALINQYAGLGGSKVNTTLAELYPSSVEMKIFTGLEAQVWMLDPLNRRYRDAGWACDPTSNVESTWIGGYAKIGAVFVEDSPRQLTHFLLKVPQVTSCVDLFVSCEETETIPAALDFDPALKAVEKQAVTVPTPPTPPTPAAGTVVVVGKSTTVVANCTGNKLVSIPLRRIGGSAGPLTVTAAAVSPTAHMVGLVSGTVVFAAGQTEGQFQFNVLPWACAGETQETETFNITFAGAGLDSTSFTSRRICIKCNKACPTDCEGDVGGCSTC